jgi:peptidoglycan hydrolase-like protein with peptidoglycan-binding domain
MDRREAHGRLQALGHKPGAVDGVYGPKTKAAVLEFQLDAFPAQPKEWDGIVGPKTWGKVQN